jgi:hypothetical protein
MKILGEQMKEEPKVERGEPTSGLEPLTCSLRVCGHVLQGIAIAAYLKGFPFSGLLSVAPYCVPGGIRVVSISSSLLRESAKERVHGKDEGD